MRFPSLARVESRFAASSVSTTNYQRSAANPKRSDSRAEGETAEGRASLPLNCLTNDHKSGAPVIFFLRGSPDPALATNWR